MKIYDISVAISGDLPVFPGDPPAKIEPVTTLGRGDTANVGQISLSAHCGTHIDAPRHYDDAGLSVDCLPFGPMMGRALVVEVHGTKVIDRGVLSRFPLKGEERLLIKTDNSALWRHPGFYEDYACLTEDGAGYLLEMGIRLIGIDYLSVERFDSDGAVHRRLLKEGVVILEGLNMDGVPGGNYELVCLPLKIAAGDGAPARAILRRRSDADTGVEFDPHTTKWPLS